MSNSNIPRGSITNLSLRDLNRVLKLEQGEDCQVGAQTWFRMEDEFKVSPHGNTGDYDTDAYWEEVDDVREDLRALKGR